MIHCQFRASLKLATRVFVSHNKNQTAFGWIDVEENGEDDRIGLLAVRAVNLPHRARHCDRR